MMSMNSTFLKACLCLGLALLTGLEIAFATENPKLPKGNKIPQLALPKTTKIPEFLKNLNIGPETGGGGGTVAYHGQVILVDYFNIPQVLENVLRKENRKNPSRMLKESWEPLAFHRTSPLQDPAFLAAFDILEQWEATPFDRVAYSLRGGFHDPLRWMFVDQEIPTKKSFRPNALGSQLQVQAAAYYNVIQNNYFLVRVSRPQWNQMNLVNQSGLLIHEALRQLQLGLQNNFDDESLQKATAIIILCQPSVKLNQYVNFLVLNNADVAEQRLGSFENATKNCGGPL